MKIRLEYTGVLEIKGVASNSDVDLPDGASVATLLNQLKVLPEHQKFVTVAVNGAQKKHHHVLQPGDRVLLSLPMGGG
jgi:hypothetical protein